MSEWSGDNVCIVRVTGLSVRDCTSGHIRLDFDLLVGEHAFQFLLLLVVAYQEGVQVGTDHNGCRGEKGSNILFGQLGHFHDQCNGHEDGVDEDQCKVFADHGEDAQ